MDEAQQLQTVTLFLAACRTEQDAGLLGRQLRFCQYAMGNALLKERERDNPFASLFRTYPTVLGPSSPDFQEGLSLAMLAGRVSWLTPEHERFIVEMSPRQTQKYTEDPLFSNALLLLNEYREQLKSRRQPE